MKKSLYFWFVLAVCTFGCGLLRAKDVSLRRSVVICIPIATLENADYQIPPGTYRLGLHRWTKTGELVPILKDVPYAGSGPLTPPPKQGVGGSRSYILIHPGSRPEHSKGCILTSRTNVERLVQLIQSYEEVSVIVAPAPQ